MINITDADLVNEQCEPDTSGKLSLINTLGPWLTGSAMAAGQAFLATGCSVPKVGKCVGCGSCVVAVVTLSGWALKRRKQAKELQQQGLEPFEIRSES
ncbi:MAG: hypothetical protein ABL925_06335 [Methylococcales bacterium]